MGMSDIGLEEYKRLVEQQVRGLLDVIQSVALGNLDVQVEIPEGIEVLSDLAVGLEMMVDDLREMMAEQQRAMDQLEQSRQQLEAALAEVTAVQRRHFRQAWEGYAEAEASLGYFRADGNEGPTGQAWLPAMTPAVQRAEIAVESDPATGTSLAVPLRLYDEVIGAVGFRREGSRPWSEDELAVVKTVVEQVALALENQRLFDEAQRATLLMEERVKALDCLNDIGRKMEETPPVPDFLTWVTDRIPAAMRHAEVCRAAIEYEGRLYGAAEAVGQPWQMVQQMRIGGEALGRVYVAYLEEHDFLDEESALLGDITRRVSGYIENRRLFEQTQTVLRETETLYHVAQILAQVRDEKQMFEAVLLEYLRALDLPQGGLLLHDEDGRYGTLQALVQGGRPVEPGRKIPIVGNPPHEQLLRTQEPVVINDALHSDLGQPVRDLAVELGYKSLLLVPILFRGKVVGALGADSTETIHEFTEREIALVRAVADQLGIALENRRLVEETRAALAEAEALYRASAALNTATTLDQVLHALIQGVELPALSRAVIGLFNRPWVGDDVPEYVETVAAWDELKDNPISRVGIRFELGLFPAVHLLRPDEPTAVGDVETDPRLDEVTRALYRYTFLARSTVMLPLVAAGQWIGFFNPVMSQTVEFDEVRLRRLMTLAAQAAVAVQSILRLKETQVALAETQALYRAARSAAALGDLTDTLQAVVDTVAEALPARRVALYAIDLERRRVTHLIRGGVEADQIDPLTFDELWDGLSGWVLRNMAPVLSPKGVPDPRESPEAQERRARRGSGSICVVPVQYRGRLLGTLTAVNRIDEPDFTQRHLDLMVGMASQAAMAIENARLFEQTRAALAEVEATHRNYLRREWQDHLRQHETLRRSGFVYDLSGPADQVVIAPDFWRPEMEQALAQRGVVTVHSGDEGGWAGLAIPITVRGETIGVLGVEAPAGERRWTEDDLALIAAVSDQLGQTLETARLFADTQRRAERERLIGEITARIRASTDIESILETTAVELGRALGTARAVVRLGEVSALQGQEAGPGTSDGTDDEPLTTG